MMVMMFMMLMMMVMMLVMCCCGCRRPFVSSDCQVIAQARRRRLRFSRCSWQRFGALFSPRVACSKCTLPCPSAHLPICSTPLLSGSGSGSGGGSTPLHSTPHDTPLFFLLSSLFSLRCHLGLPTSPRPCLALSCDSFGDGATLTDRKRANHPQPSPPRSMFSVHVHVRIPSILIRHSPLAIRARLIWLDFRGML